MEFSKDTVKYTDTDSVKLNDGLGSASYTVNELAAMEAERNGIEDELKRSTARLYTEERIMKLLKRMWELNEILADNGESYAMAKRASA